MPFRLCYNPKRCVSIIFQVDECSGTAAHLNALSPCIIIGFGGNEDWSTICGSQYNCCRILIVIDPRWAVFAIEFRSGGKSRDICWTPPNWTQWSTTTCVFYFPCDYMPSSYNILFSCPSPVNVTSIMDKWCFELVDMISVSLGSNIQGTFKKCICIMLR